MWDTGNTLKNYVINEIICNFDGYDDIRDWFRDMQKGGCSSGMVSGLIYYNDTHEFYDEFYSEIEDLRYTFEQDTGAPLKVEGDLKNWYAWYAFEETAYQIACELEIDL